MINELMESLPFFSTGDAMRCLLIFDTNVSHACAVYDYLSARVKDETPCSFASSLPQLKLEPNCNCSTSPTMPESSSRPNKSNFWLPYPQIGPQSDISTVVGIPNLRGAVPNLNPGNENPIPLSDSVVEESFSPTIYQSSLPEEKPASRKKLHVGSSQGLLGQKSVQSEKCSSGTCLRPNCSFEAASYSSNAGNPSCKMCGQSEAQDKKDEMLRKLASRVQELKAQEQRCTEIAQQIVMGATRILSKVKTELQTLKQEKQKKLSEMENELSKGYDDVRRLELENSKLRKEMEVEKLQASESEASCKEVLRREVESLKKLQSCKEQKALFQEELVTEKCKRSTLQQHLKQAKEHLRQTEDLRDHEENLKDRALTHANSLRKEREQIEASAKSKEDEIRSEAESGLQKYKDDIASLEHQIAQLRLMNDSSKIVSLQQGKDGIYASCLLNGRKDRDANLISKRMDSPELGSGDLQRERECVICMTAPMSVLFLPCAHQVVCAKCNERHEKKGMKDCPTCMTPIQRRILVHFACK